MLSPYEFSGIFDWVSTYYLHPVNEVQVGGVPPHIFTSCLVIHGRRA
jgi:hypothetical protein